MFITFEGIEGSGKSTQIKRLADHLRQTGSEVTVTREPGGTSIGDQIRSILLDSQNKNMAFLCEELLYWAGRAQHLEELIKPALARGQIVLCDRYVDSTVAYQGYARGLDFKQIAQFENLVCAGLKVNRTFLFDLPTKEGMGRAMARIEGLHGPKEDRFEREALDFHEKVRQGYLALAKREPGRFLVLDAAKNPDEIEKDIWAVMEPLL